MVTQVGWRMAVADTVGMETVAEAKQEERSVLYEAEWALQENRSERSSQHQPY